jgi:L-lysine exporter family protein LysE/ArgO
LGYLSNYFSKYAKNKNVWKIINIFIITFMGFLILFILKEMIS